jgi:hypothetical protein
MEHDTSPVKAHGCLLDHGSLAHKIKYLIWGKVSNGYLGDLGLRLRLLGKVFPVKPVKGLLWGIEKLSDHTHR